MTGNSIMVIAPYKWNGLWVFDDPHAGLYREAFIAGADEIIDMAIATKGCFKGIRAEDGFNLLFGVIPFPGHEIELTWLREEGKGNVYACDEFGLEGWLCPALFKYFNTAPKTIYAELRPVEVPVEPLPIPRGFFPPALQIVREDDDLIYMPLNQPEEYE